MLYSPLDAGLSSRPPSQLSSRPDSALASLLAPLLASLLNSARDAARPGLRTNPVAGPLKCAQAGKLQAALHHTQDQTDGTYSRLNSHPGRILPLARRLRASYSIRAMAPAQARCTLP